MRGVFTRQLTICAAALLCCAAGTATAQQSVGADVIVGELPDLSNNAASGSIDAFAVGTTSCNKGNTPLNWWTGGTDNRHPVIGQNVFRLHNGRFEHIGQAWLKHGFTALQGNVCVSGFGFACTATAGTTLGTGCSDPYGSGLNNGQSGLGPKWQVNAASGLFPYPFNSPAFSGSIARRLQINVADINATTYAGARYFIEGQYVCGDDAAAGNKSNNASYREVTFSGTSPEYNIAFAVGSTTQREKPGIQAWKDIDPTITLASADIASDGRFLLGCKVTQSGANYTYEYALQNLNSHRCAGSFSVPFPSGASVTNTGFHDIFYHSGEPVTVDTDWVSTSNATDITWSGAAYSGTPPVYTMDLAVPYKVASFTAGTGNDHSANVLRWGTLFNFRFTTTVAPALGSVQVGLWRPGTPSSFSMAVPTPGGATMGTSTGTCCIGTSCSITTPSGCSGTFGTIGATCSPNPCDVGSCCNVSGNCTVTSAAGCSTGTYTSGGICSPNPCPAPTGACCATSGACSITTQAACVGTYQGDGVTCTITCPVVANNDACASPVTLCEGVTATGDNNLAGTDITVNCTTSNGDLWYTYTPTTNATVTVETLAGGTVGDTVVSVHTGQCGALTQIACDDDSGPGLLSLTTFSGVANTTYRVRVASFGTPGTRGTILVRCTGGAACAVTATGACCVGTTCSVTAQAACTGSYQGNASTCGATGNPTTCCPANFNDVGGVTVQDIFDFLNAYFANDPTADFNNAGGVTVQDIFDFLSAYFVGCPG